MAVVDVDVVWRMWKKQLDGGCYGRFERLNE